MTRVRLIYYIVDPYADVRAAVAALVDRDGETTLVRAGQLPRSLSASAQAAAERALADVEAAPVFDVLPVGAGPQVVLGPPRTLPAGVADPASWVRDMLLDRAA